MEGEEWNDQEEKLSNFINPNQIIAEQLSNDNNWINKPKKELHGSQHL